MEFSKLINKVGRLIVRQVEAKREARLGLEKRNYGPTISDEKC